MLYHFHLFLNFSTLGVQKPIITLHLTRKRQNGRDYLMEEVQKVADALMGVIRLMVDEPDVMTMILSVGPQDETAIHLSVSATDAGKVIGKEGRTAKCLRIIVLAMAKKAKRRITLHFDQAGYQHKKYPSLYP
jgi:uncharacterized protein